MITLYTPFCRSKSTSLITIPSSFAMRSGSLVPISRTMVSARVIKRFDVSNWTGDNILGFALMEVREKLKEADK